MRTKLYILLTILAFTKSTLKSQSIDTIKAIVYYQFKFISDSLKQNSFYTENMMLCLGNNSSIYKSFDYYQYDSTLKINQRASDGVKQYQAPAKSISPNQLFKYPNENYIISKSNLGRFYLIYDKYPKIEWQIGIETKKIDGLLCQKAIGKLKGRTYEAWFTLDLPFANGPWKLGDLPGLIIEAKDSKNEVFFKFTGINSHPIAQFITSPNGIKVSQLEFNKLSKLAEEDPLTFLNNSGLGLTNVKANGVPVDLQSYPKIKTHAFNHIEINNKIELSN